MKRPPREAERGKRVGAIFQWHEAFPTDDLTFLRAMIPECIGGVQLRAQRSHDGFADPDGEEVAYGRPMSRGVQKDFLARLRHRAGFREERTPHAQRRLTYLGEHLLYIHRVGPRLPIDTSRIRFDNIPEERRERLETYSNDVYREPGLFDLPPEPLAPGEPATLGDAVAASGDGRKGLLFLVYFNSRPSGVGSVMWGPAHLDGNHLVVSAPDRLAPWRRPRSTAARDDAAVYQRAVNSFHDSVRPKTFTSLRLTPLNDEDLPNG